jgi:hypothetical protein
VQVPLIIGHNEKESRLSEYFTGAQYATIAATYGMNNETATLREKVGDFVKNNVNDVSDLNAAVDELLGFYPLSAGGDFTSNYDVYTAVATDRYAFHMMIEEYAPCLRRLTFVCFYF